MQSIFAEEVFQGHLFAPAYEPEEGRLMIFVVDGLIWETPDDAIAFVTKAAEEFEIPEEEVIVVQIRVIENGHFEVVGRYIQTKVTCH